MSCLYLLERGVNCSPSQLVAPTFAEHRHLDMRLGDSTNAISQVNYVKILGGYFPLSYKHWTWTTLTDEDAP